MSKTIRRKHGHDLNYAIRDGNHADIRFYVPYYQPCSLKGKARRQVIARYHSDMRVGWSAPKLDRQLAHAKHRAEVNRELARYYKDNEYEVQVRDNPRWPYWL